MITDKLTTFCSATALNTGAAGVYMLGDDVDIEVLRELGFSELYLVVNVAVTATSGGSATCAVSLVSDAQSPLTPASATVHITSAAFPVADMVAGTNLLTVKLPLQGAEYEQYLGIKQTTGGVAFTGGAIEAFLTPTVQANRSYPDYRGA